MYNSMLMLNKIQFIIVYSVSNVDMAGYFLFVLLNNNIANAGMHTAPLLLQQTCNFYLLHYYYNKHVIVIDI